MSIYTSSNLGQFLIEVAKGNVHGHSRYARGGKNQNVESAAPEMIWFSGGDYVFTEVGETVSFVSDNVADAAAGTGWRQMVVIGLDQDYNEIFEILTLNGTTPVNTVLSYIFIRVVTASIPGGEVGSSAINLGTIVGTGNTTAKTFVTVEPLSGGEQSLIDIVPAGKTLFVTSFYLSSKKTTGGQLPEIDFKTFLQPLGLGIVKVREDTIETDVNTIIDINAFMPYPIPEKTRIWLSATTSENNTYVDGTLGGFLVDNKIGAVAGVSAVPQIQV